MAITDYSGGKKGNPRFDIMTVHHDCTTDTEPNGVCNEPHFKVFAAAHDSGWQEDDYIAICKPFYSLTGIPQTRGDSGRAWGEGDQPTCQNVGNSLNNELLTNTMAHTLVHEYTHFTVFTDALGGPTTDHTYRVPQTVKLDKAVAKMNAESYAMFATELMWSVLCE
jgi:hypothetical protein